MADVDPPSPQSVHKARRTGWIIVALAIAIATFLAIRRVGLRVRHRTHQMLDAGPQSHPSPTPH